MILKKLSLTTLMILAGLSSANAHIGDHSHVFAETGFMHFLNDHGLMAWFVLTVLVVILFPLIRNR